MSHDRNDEAGRLAREAFRRAAGDADPDVDRLLVSVPALLAEAGRRRRAAAEPIAAAIALAGRALPRLAAAALVLVAVATVLLVKDTRGAGHEARAVDALILTGTVGGDVADPLLEAVAVEHDGDG